MYVDYWWGISMAKIKISIEGEDVSDIIQELFSIGIELLKSNRKEIQELIRLLADDAIEVLQERKILENGAQLYRKINNEINWTYKRNKSKQ
jgi:hypothetical protein